MNKSNSTNLEIKNIILITDGLEEYIDLITISDINFKYYVTSISNLSKKINNLKNCQRDNLLIIINNDIFEEKLQQKIKEITSKKYSIPRPHYLFIILNDDSKYIEDKLENDQNFIFPLSKIQNEKKNTTPLYFYIKMVFQRTRDISRLENYIINAFRTIVDAEIINKQKQEIEKLYHELDELSKLDYLTKVLNRKAFFESMNAEINRTLRKEKRLKKIRDRLTELDKEGKNHQKLSKEFRESHINFSCVMIDIDHFKKVNDTYGHLVGDQVLKQIGEILKSKKFFRDNDIIGRYGGEEFIIILTETASKEAMYPVERLRDQLKKITFKGNNDIKFSITISVGISEFRINDESNEEVINRADKALYYAKQNGRDQIVIYENVFKV